MSPNILRVLAGALAFFALMLAIAGWRMGRVDIAPALDVMPSETAFPAADHSRSATPQYTVVTAARPLQAGERLQPADLLIVDYPVAFPESFKDIDSLMGQQILRAVHAGQILRSSDFEPGNPLAGGLEPGTRGIAVAIDEVIGIGGHLKPGDKVDVLYQAQSPDGARYQLARRILGNVTVMSYGEEVQGVPIAEPSENDRRNAASTIARTAVLSVDTEVAPLLLLAETTGRLRLALVGTDEANTETALHDGGDELFVARDVLHELLGPSFLQLDVTHDEVAIPEPEPEPQPRQVRQYIGGQSQMTVLQP